MKEVKIGFEVGTGEQVNIIPSHLVVTGLTQASGKTTTLEALIQRLKCKAVVFKTKTGGEKGFTQGTLVPPFFQEQSDWEYVSDLLEAERKEKMRFERSWIIDICKGTESLEEVKHNIDEKLTNPKIRGIDKGVYTCLQAYLNKILPQLKYAKFSNTLVLQEGINIMNLEQFTDEVKSLIIRSVLNEVLANSKKTVVVIPEAWKFLPEGRGNPCKPAAEAFARQGASNQNFLWIDSQDITGVDKSILKQSATWIMGYQSELNEAKRTLDQLPIPKKSKPSIDDIMSLKLGQFYVSTREFTKKVYVQPAWMETEIARKIARGELDISEAKAPDKVAPFAIQQAGKVLRKQGVNPIFVVPQPQATTSEVQELQKNQTEMRMDFFEQLQNIRGQFQPIQEELYALRHQPPQAVPTVDEIAALVLQKIKIPVNGPSVQFDKDALIREILASPNLQARSGITYEVAPLEKLKKDILEETKQKLLAEISSLDGEQKKLLKYVEASGKAVSYSELTEKCLLKSVGGPSLQNTRVLCKGIGAKGLINLDYGHGKVAPRLKDEIKRFLFEAPEQEVQQVYNHILAEMLK